MVERKKLVENDLSFLNPKEREFIVSVIGAMQSRLKNTNVTSPDYEDLKQNIKQFQNLDDYDYRFINKDEQIIGIEIKGIKKES
jgi:hypothetical protein